MPLSGSRQLCVAFASENSQSAVQMVNILRTNIIEEITDESIVEKELYSMVQPRS